MKIIPLNPDPGCFTLVFQNEQEKVFSGKVWVKSLDQCVHVLIIHQLNKQKQTKSYKIYFCTDDTIPELEILKAYKARFQIEFLYRDGMPNNLQDYKTAKLEMLNGCIFILMLYLLWFP